MALRYPNRTGEVGTYNSGGTVTLPSTDALPGLRTFAAAASAGKLAATDHLGLHVKRSGNDSIWLVAIAQYSGGTLTIIETEDSAGTLGDGDQVEVTAVLTAKMLDSASLSYTPTVYFMGPDYWDYANATGWPAPPTYDAGTGEATLNGRVNVNGTWNEGFAPARVAFEIFTPIDATNIVPVHFSFRLNTLENSAGDWQSSDIIAGLAPGDWAAFDFATSSVLTGDSSDGIIKQLRGTVYNDDDPSIVAAWKFRKLRFY